jgi:ParB family chromosome partitioning protein
MTTEEFEYYDPALENFKRVYAKGPLINENKVIIANVQIRDLVPFRNHVFDTYTGDRLASFAENIKEIGLQNPIIVRPIAGGKYEILSGHNRVNAIKLMGEQTINAILKHDVTDEMAERIVLDSNTNQQSFLNWSFTQQFRVIKACLKYIQDNSQQGKRNDLIPKQPVSTVNTSEQSKPGEKTRDKAAAMLNISPAKFERYRSIAKLDDDIMTSLGNLIDNKRLTFMGAIRISKLKTNEMLTILRLLNKSPEIILKGKKVQTLHNASLNSEIELSEQEIIDVITNT